MKRTRRPRSRLPHICQPMTYVVNVVLWLELCSTSMISRVMPEPVVSCVSDATSWNTVNPAAPMAADIAAVMRGQLAIRIGVTTRTVLMLIS